jgi:hypothetical protein
MPTQEQQEIAQMKGRISRLEARLEFLYRHLDVTFVEDTRLSDDPKVIAALKANNVTEAIKLYRQATNAGLEEARMGVEEMRSRLGI